MQRLLGFAFVFSFACGRPTGSETPDPIDPGPTSCVSDGDCDTGKSCDVASGTCVGGCGGTHLDLQYVAPNLLLVMDRSCSMKKPLDGTTTMKWQAAVDAVNNVVATYDDQIRWGATLFPDTTGETCTQDAIPLPVADGNAPGLSTMLTASLDPADPLFPDDPCVTNIDTALQQAALDPSLADPAHKSYLMLVTDGKQSSCNAAGGDAGSLAIVQDLQAHGVSTFVVGFGSGVDAANMNALALAGGVPLAGATSYYQADTAVDLDQAFQSIGELVVSCTYHVDQPPQDLAETWVFFDHVVVPQDASNGWDYDAATQNLTFHGTACGDLQAHAVTDLDVVFGCPTQPIL